MLKNNDTYKSCDVNKLYPEYLKQKKGVIIDPYINWRKLLS